MDTETHGTTREMSAVHRVHELRHQRVASDTQHKLMSWCVRFSSLHFYRISWSSNVLTRSVRIGNCLVWLFSHHRQLYLMQLSFNGLPLTDLSVVSGVTCNEQNRMVLSVIIIMQAHSSQTLDAQIPFCSLTNRFKWSCDRKIGIWCVEH